MRKNEKVVRTEKSRWGPTGVWFCRSCTLGFDGECVDLLVGAELVGLRILSPSQHQDHPGTFGASKWAPASERC